MYQTSIPTPRDGFFRRFWKGFVTFAEAVDTSPDEIYARRLDQLEHAVRDIQARMPEGN